MTRKTASKSASKTTAAAKATKPARTGLPIEIDARALAPLGMTPEVFLRDYWQKRPLLIRNAFPDFETPVQPEDLAGLACEETALSRIVMHDRANDRWTLRHGPFQEDEFPGMPHQDWTCLLYTSPSPRDLSTSRMPSSA